jgi:hypothetical protein
MTPEEREYKERRIEEINILLGLTSPNEIDSESDVQNLQSEDQVALMEERDALIEELSTSEEQELSD